PHAPARCAGAAPQARAARGVAFLGAPAPDTEEIVCRLAEVRRLGRLPRLDPLTPETLAAAFAEHFHLEDFQDAGA
ncbi:MAG: hypothetical protein AAGM38_17635, partial [Pseudomonadota bacterium]